MKVDLLYPSKFLSGRHLPSTGVLVQIESVALEALRVAANAPEVKKPVLVVTLIAPTKALPGVEKRPTGYALAMSETLAREIAHVVDSDDTDDWRGRQVVLFPTTIKVAGRDVLTIAARERRPGPAAQPPTQATSTAPAAAAAAGNGHAAPAGEEASNTQ